MNRKRWMKLVAVAMIACVTTAVAAEKAAAPVRGNPDSKVYHKAACRYYKVKGSSKEFKSEAEAVKAGYKPCKRCGAPKQEKPASSGKAE